MPLPPWVKPVYAENAAAAMARGTPKPSETWGTLLAHAQAILESCEDALGQNPAEPGQWRDLVSAARVLERAASPTGLEKEENRRTAAILAACAHGMSGAPAAAATAIEEHNLLAHSLTLGERTALALSVPSLSGGIIPQLPEGSDHRACVENTAAFLLSGDNRELESARAALNRAAGQEPDPWDGYLLRMSRVTLAQLGRLRAEGNTGRG